MIRKLTFIALAGLAAILAPAAMELTTAQAQHGYVAHGSDLFYNYYVGPARCAGGVPARMYVSPRPVPAVVGHTNITYQPLMPHEFLYKHRRTYHRYQPAGPHGRSSYTRTTVRWR